VNKQHMAARDLDFTGKTVLITGAARGIGRATALAFAAREASVVIGDLDSRAEDTFTASVAGLRADPGMAPYGAAKHAVVGLTKAAAITGAIYPVDGGRTAH
jgi:NAD(P)-dependent dehydrogenase (short-subunit alcohol dehydrogenase family)